MDGPTGLLDCRLKDQRSVTRPFLSGGRTRVPVTHEDEEEVGARGSGDRWSRRRSTLRNHGL